MSDQDNGQISTLQRPTTDDPKAWRAYWKAQGWPWRTEPEIDAERQKYLAERRAIVPDVAQGIYAFRGIKLSRGDVEWLLATHDNERGPINWNDESQRGRTGLDLRGADLRHVDLHHLPLACLCGGINRRNWNETTLKQRIMAEIHLEEASLRNAHLEAACLTRAHLEGADIGWAHLEGADLYRAHLEGATLW
jgi:Pentapeptide repeats (8 copies)